VDVVDAPSEEGVSLDEDGAGVLLGVVSVPSFMW
jgi:hypothetical protein